MGIVSDWTVEDWYSGSFIVAFTDFTAASIRDGICKYIHQYEPSYDLDEKCNQLLSETDKNQPIVAEMSTDHLRIYGGALLQWIYDHFAYHRRQSLKTIYYNCKLVAEDKIDDAEFQKKLENYFVLSNDSFFLQEIINAPHDDTSWFHVFWRKDNATDSLRGEVIYPSEEVVKGGSLHQHFRLIDNNEQRNLYGSLRRFLESYGNDHRLNFISGILMLLMHDYDDTDGESRLKAGLTYIRDHKDEKSIADYLSRLSAVCRSCMADDKNTLARTLISHFPAKNEVMLINRYLQDDYSLLILDKLFAQRISSITGRIHERLTTNG